MPVSRQSTTLTILCLKSVVALPQKMPADSLGSEIALAGAKAARHSASIKLIRRASSVRDFPCLYPLFLTLTLLIDYMKIRNQLRAVDALERVFTFRIKFLVPASTAN